MLFNSLQFVIFFIVVTLAYFSLSWRGRWVLLLLASCYFYMVFKPVFVVILFATIFIDYFAGLWLEKEKSPRRKKLLLVLSLVSNIGILAFFKYFDFLGDSINDFLSAIGYHAVVPNLGGFIPARVAHWITDGAGQVILPIGLSFHTFQAMSYTIEVYRGHQPAERNFGIYALYVMFYPQLVAGPIERPQNMLFQFHSFFKYDFENVKNGLMQMAFGFFKKVVIADRLAMVVDHAYANPSQHNGLTMLVATAFYSFQIYCDFSGYSDIAIGAARVMGFKLMENFRSPYESASIVEFWSRWHISLSTWFRDYLYITLGGNRYGNFRRDLNVFAVFLISGLWHGPSWNFVVWGGLHGLFNVLGQHQRKFLRSRGVDWSKNPFVHTLNIVFTFILVTLAWVFFRNKSEPLARAGLILRKIFNFSFSDHISSPLNSVEMFFCIALIIFLLIKERFFLHIPTRSTPVFLGLFLLTCWLVYFFGVFNTNQFIYFQF